jgi:hypothetical protein
MARQLTPGDVFPPYVVQTIAVQGDAGDVEARST